MIFVLNVFNKVVNVMKFNKIIFIFLLFLGVCSNAQIVDSVIAKPLSEYPESQLSVDEEGQKYYYDKKQKAKIYEINGETVVVMDELVLRSNRIKFNNQLDKNYYYFLNKKLNRVYPYFLVALSQYRDIQKDMSEINKSAEQRKYARERYNKLADEYTAQLRDLTTTEGNVFCKLMFRATGKTVFEIVKELRGGWSAFWWNVKGNIADVHIKEPYDPKGNRSDLFIESLLHSNWKLGYLKPYHGHEKYFTKKY